MGFYLVGSRHSAIDPAVEDPRSIKGQGVGDAGGGGRCQASVDLGEEIRGGVQGLWGGLQRSQWTHTGHTCELRSPGAAPEVARTPWSRMVVQSVKRVGHQTQSERSIQFADESDQ